MRKYYDTTIEITLHTNRKTLEEMIRTLVGNRKSVDEEKNFSTEKKFFRRARVLEKKIARRANV